MENIRYGKLDATDEECTTAAKLANADCIMVMEQGRITERGNHEVSFKRKIVCDISFHHRFPILFRCHSGELLKGRCKIARAGKA